MSQITSPSLREESPVQGSQNEVCDICGNATVVWRKCKQLCVQCGTILRSCADV